MSTQIFSSAKTQTAQTPQEMFDYIQHRFGRLTDMAPPCHKSDSLAESTKWPLYCYVNPPFNEITKWLKKAIEQHEENLSKIIFLIPFRPYTEYFQKYSKKFSFIELIYNPVIFIPFRRAIPHQMCLVSIGLYPQPGSATLPKIPNFFICKNRIKMDFLDVQKKMKRDFDTDTCVMLTGATVIPKGTFYIPFTNTTVRKTHEQLMDKNYIKVFPRLLYKTPTKNKKYFLGSLGLVQSTKTPRANKDYEELKIYLNTVFAMKSRNGSNSSCK